jgi:hypothetical protein
MLHQTKFVAWNVIATMKINGAFNITKINSITGVSVKMKFMNNQAPPGQ